MMSDADDDMNGGEDGEDASSEPSRSDRAETTISIAEARAHRRGRGKAQEAEIRLAIQRINQDHAVVMAGTRVVVLQERLDEKGLRDIAFLGTRAFFDWFASEQYRTGREEESIGQLWWRSAARRQYSGVTFIPGREAPPGWYNLWGGYSVEPREGPFPHIFWDHLFTNVARKNQELFIWIVTWYAHLIQRPWERPGTALVLRGKEGTGKTKPGEIIGSLLRQHYLLVDQPRYLVGNFNAHLKSCLFLQADEAIWAGDRHAESTLKSLITASDLMIEPKGLDPIRVPCYLRLMMTSNASWIVPAGFQSRRWCVVDVGDTVCQDRNYFASMEHELDHGGRENLLWALLNWDLGQADIHRVPMTDALFEQREQSLDRQQEWWEERLMEGTPSAGDSSWPPWILSSVLHASYLAHVDRHDRGGYKRGDRQFFIHQKPLLPPTFHRRRKRIETYDEHGSAVKSNSWVYFLPSLEDCRAHFEELMGGKIDWGERDDG